MFDLRAVLRLDGSQFSNALNRIARQTQHANNQTQYFTDSAGRLRDHLGRFASSSNNAGNSVSRLGRAMTSPIRSIGSLTTSLNGLVGAYAAVRGAQEVFDNTVGEAAKYEQSTIMISAMLNDKELGKQYMELVDRFAIDSPILDSQGMLGNSKSFLTASKDMKQLEQMWSLAERMAAIDPYQGLEGAVFALRELFSGDAISMVRRFEMPRAVMNDIKKMELDDQLRELDKFFNSIGMTQKLIDDMGGTTLGVWAQIKEATNVILRTMGAPALGAVKKFLDGVRNGMATVSEVMANRQRYFSPEEFNKDLQRAQNFEEFQKTGAKIIENVMVGLTQAAKGIGNWMLDLKSNPEFLKQTTIFGQVKFIIEDIYQRFLSWLDGGGRDKIIKTTSDLMQILIAGIEASMESIIPVATAVGSAIGSGILSGIKSSLSESWLSRLLSDPVGFIVNEPMNLTNKITGRKKKWDAFGYQTHIDYKTGKNKKGKSHAGGLDRIPYNGYQATLHKDERVLTAEEAKAFRNGKGGAVTIAKLADQIIIREDADIDRIAEALAYKIKEAGMGGA